MMHWLGPPFAADLEAMAADMAVLPPDIQNRLRPIVEQLGQVAERGVPSYAALLGGF